MAKNNRNTQEPVGTEAQPFGGTQDDATRIGEEADTRARDYSPTDAERQERTEAGHVKTREDEVGEANDSEVGAPARELGTSAEVSLFSWPDTYLIKSGDSEYTFQGDVEDYLTRSGVTDISYTDDRSSS